MRKCTAGLESVDCKSNCIHWGRYCAMDSIGSQYTDRFHGWQVCFLSAMFLIFHEGHGHVSVLLRILGATP